MSVASVYATFADADEAARIGRAMVEQRLAACVNVLGPCRSIYRWEGAVQEADEVAAIFKTTQAGAAVLIGAITAAHGYDLPAAVAWEVSAATPAFADWITANIA